MCRSVHQLQIFSNHNAPLKEVEKMEHGGRTDSSLTGAGGRKEGSRITFANHAIEIPVEIVSHVASFLSWNKFVQLRLVNRAQWMHWFRHHGFYDLVAEKMLAELTEEGRDDVLPAPVLNKKDGTPLHLRPTALLPNLQTVSVSITQGDHVLRILVAIPLNQRKEEKYLRAARFLLSTGHVKKNNETDDGGSQGCAELASYCMSALLSRYDVVFLRRAGSLLDTLLDNSPFAEPTDHEGESLVAKVFDKDLSLVEHTEQKVDISTVRAITAAPRVWTGLYGVLTTLSRSCSMSPSDLGEILESAFVTASGLAKTACEIAASSAGGGGAAVTGSKPSLFPRVLRNPMEASKRHLECSDLTIYYPRPYKQSYYSVTQITLATYYTVVNPIKFDALGMGGPVCRVELVDLQHLTTIAPGVLQGNCVQDIYILRAPNLRSIQHEFARVYGHHQHKHRAPDRGR